MADQGTSGFGPDRPVFISFAGAASRPQADALHERLTASGIPAFLDSSDLAPGDRISPRLLEAVLAARVVVLILDPTYFTRPYCREELDAALGPYDELLRRAAPAAELDEALLPIVVAWRVRDGMTDELKLLPPAMRDTVWPHADAGEDVTRLVRKRLARVDRTIGQRLEALGALTSLRDRLLAAIDTPAPAHLGAVHFVCAPPGGPPASLDADFVGRSEALWTLHRALAAGPPGRAEPAVALEGAGGAGKTQLAAEYLRRYGPAAFSGGLVWVHADVPDRLEAQLHAVLRALRPGVPELAGYRAAGRDVRVELAQALRQAAARGRVLYVVDDVPESEREALPLGHWCPAQGEVALVITSRGRTTVGSGVVALPVRELPAGPATAVLRHEVGARDAFPAAGWNEIAGWVDGLPLALRVLNAALRVRAISPDELLALSRQGGPARGVDRLRAALPGAGVRGVEEAFAVSYGLLPTPARRAARLVACLAPQPIPIALVAALLGPEDRALLSGRSFASPVDGDPVDLYGRMHPVLADHLRGLTEDGHELLGEICAAALTVMTPTAAGDPAAWPLLDACRPHAAAAFDQWRGLAPGSGEESAPFVLLGLIVGDLIRRQGRPSEAAVWAERCLELANETLGPDHPRTLEAMGSLAAALFDLGDLARPAALQERVLHARTRLLGQEHPDTLRAKASLASTVHALGSLDGALRMNQEVLAARARSLGEEHPDTLWSKAAVARTLHALDRLDDAVGLAERLLDAQRRLHGDAHPDTVEAMEILAAILRDRGELVPALRLGERALELRVRLLGGAHPDTLGAMRGLAATLRSLGAPDRAVARWRRILASSPEEC